MQIRAGTRLPILARRKERTSRYGLEVHIRVFKGAVIVKSSGLFVDRAGGTLFVFKGAVVGESCVACKLTVIDEVLFVAAGAVVVKGTAVGASALIGKGTCVLKRAAQSDGQRTRVLEGSFRLVSGTGSHCLGLYAPSYHMHRKSYSNRAAFSLPLKGRNEISPFLPLREYRSSGTLSCKEPCLPVQNQQSPGSRTARQYNENQGYLPAGSDTHTDPAENGSLSRFRQNA